MKRVSDADLRLLRIFATVADSKGFSGAQAALNLSLSSISGYVTALERRLGVRLCSRGRAGFALTDKGAVILGQAQRLFAAVEEFTANAGAVRGRLTGSLSIGVVDCTVTDPDAPLRSALRRFNAREHSVRIELVTQTPLELQRGVLDGRLNLAVGSFPARIAALATQQLYRERNAFYCGAGHPLFDRPSVTMEDIRAQRIVARGYWRRADLSRIGVEREAASVDNMEAQAILVLSESYVGYLPKHYAAAWEARKQMRALLPGELEYEAPFAVVTRRGSAPVAVVRQFIEDLLASLPGRPDSRKPAPKPTGPARRQPAIRPTAAPPTVSKECRCTLTSSWPIPSPDPSTRIWRRLAGRALCRAAAAATLRCPGRTAPRLGAGVDTAGGCRGDRALRPRRAADPAVSHVVAQCVRQLRIVPRTSVPSETWGLGCYRQS
jgi:DNA-binding transcriptional LysR family regulator